MTDAKEETLAQKMAAAAIECAYIQKDAVNAFHKYNYASAAAVLEKVNAAVHKRGIAVCPQVRLLTDVGAPVVVVQVTLHVRAGLETMVIEGLGAGSDKGDKAVMKAQTAALKYAWMMAFSISTGDDPEADVETDKASLDDNQVAIAADQARLRTQSDALATSWLTDEIKPIYERKDAEALMGWCYRNGYEWNTLHPNARSKVWRGVLKAAEASGLPTAEAKRALAESPAPEAE